MNENDYILERKEYIIQKDKYGNDITVRDLQLQILSIMKEIDRICRKNNIKYCLIAGSALGICNYKGFIPWDDDIDMAVDISDWDKFIEVMKSDLSSEFYFDSY